MSTSQALGLVAGGIAFYISGGNPQAFQWGYMIGPATGGMSEPEVTP